MATVSSLWIGKSLAVPHKIALMSFLYYGHNVNLYVYDMSLEVPKGINKLDANLILQESQIFLHYGKLAAFSDLFRYKMIQKTSDMWIDIDTICLSDDFFEKDSYVFLEESPGIYSGTLLKMPPNSNLCSFLNKRADNIKNSYTNIEVDFAKNLNWDSWTYLGPRLVTDAINLLSLNSYAKSVHEAAVIEINHEDPFDLLWNPANFDLVYDRLSDAKCLTFFNSWIDQRNLDKNTILTGSVMNFFQKTFMEDTGE